MSRFRSLLAPTLSALIALGGVSFAMEAVEPTSGEVPAEESPAPDEGTESPSPEESPAPEESPLPEEPPAEEPPAEEPPASEPPIEESPAPEGEPVDEGSDDGTSDQKFSTEGCPEGFSGNHGQYVSGSEGTPKNEAAHSECGKPVEKEKKDKQPKDGADDSDDDSDDSDDGTVDEGSDA